MRSREAAPGAAGGSTTSWLQLTALLRVVAVREPLVGRLIRMRERLCSKVGCAREAVTTMTYDYADQMAAVGPLGAGDDPHAHDLCALHTERLSVPQGWVVVRHETLRA
ncbi:hypothetical protein GCM10022219_01370 [Microbacterium oryzae]